MFVPSLSWQNDHLYIYRWLKKTVLGQCVMVVGNNHLVSDSTFTNNLFESSDAGVVRQNTLVLRHLILETINLPRQARDKHRERSKKEALSQVYSESDWTFRGAQNAFFEKPESLPRQARDRHRKS